MDASFTAEQDEIRRTLRELLLKRCGPEDLRAAVLTPAGYDPALWEALARQLGLPGLALPEAYGGVGCSATELALACEESGRSLAPSPLLATAVLGAPLVLALGTGTQRAELLPRLASGELTAALAVPGAALATALGLVGDNGGDWAGEAARVAYKRGGSMARGVSMGRRHRCSTDIVRGSLWWLRTQGGSRGRGHCCISYGTGAQGSYGCGRRPWTRRGPRPGSNCVMWRRSCWVTRTPM